MASALTLFTQALSRLTAAIDGQCHLCNLPSNNGFWCQDCTISMMDADVCYRCGLNLVMGDVCGQCLVTPPSWDNLYAIANYRTPIADYLWQFKENRKFYLALPLSQLLAEQINDKPDLITCVPIHWRRKLLRGFNQAELLGGLLSEQLNCPFNPKIFSQRNAKNAQKDLTAAQRLANLNNIFTLKISPKVSHVAIVDDVVTTGTTVRLLTILLKKAGIERVDIYCLCRTKLAD